MSKQKPDPMKPTLDDVLRDRSLLDSMTLGDMLSMIGMDIEVEDVEHPENNARLTELSKGFVPDRNQQ